MATAKSASASESFFAGLFRFGLYKRNQGRVTRQVTAAAVVAGFAYLAYSLYLWFGGAAGAGGGSTSLAVGLGVLAVGVLVAFRLVNWPKFADFLIATEAEMKKVSWPSRAELIRGTVVVLVVMFFLAAVLFVYDAVWVWVFTQLGVLESGAAGPTVPS